MGFNSAFKGLMINCAVGMNVELVRVGKEEVTAGKFL